MKRCLELALKGGGFVHPNPMVGSVIVHNEVVIGEGYHSAFGQAHAEVNAVDSVVNKSLLPFSILYVSLEPCAHTGKTPPCTSLIISSGIKNVIIATSDPNPLVAGKGIKTLKEAGVKVTVGVLEKEARYINRRFFTFHTQKRPYVILKWAESADGFIGNKGKGKKQVRISNDTSRTLVHKWRSEEQAILVGCKTVINDNPALNVRYWKGPDPIRILIDSGLSVPVASKFFRKMGRALVINTIKEESQTNIRYIKVPKSPDRTHYILEKLFENQIVSVFVEGGAETLTYFLKSGLWDECRVFRSEKVIGGNVAAPSLPSGIPECFNFDGDKLMVFRNKG